MEFHEKIQELRKNKGLTQEELAELLYVSRTAVSKWESGRGYPSIDSLKGIAEIFSVSVDYLLSTHDKKEIKPGNKPYSPKMIMLVVMLGIFTIATLIFVIFWILGHKIWLVYVASVPVFLITLLVLNSVWFNRKNNLPIVAVLVLSIFLLIYYSLIKYNPWQILLVAFPAEAVVYFSFQIKKGYFSPNRNKTL